MSSRRRSPLLGFVSGSSYSRPSSSKPPRRSTSSRKTASSASSLPPPEAPSPPPAVPPRRRPAPAPAPAPKPAKPDKPDKPDRPAAWPASSEPSTILLALIAFRLLNTLVVRTFFQPDEFFQSLEPAWQAAFGMDQGAWMTWEWRNHLRSSLHPLLFAVFYRVADLLALLLRLSFATRAHLLIAAPKPAQAVVAALGDFYTWKLARRVYGGGSRKTWTVLTLTVVSPWQWFCSTRTLSNCLETTITVVALDLWPWRWSWVSDKPERKPRIRDVDLNRFRLCLCLAGLACVLRPTNIFIWIPLASLILHRCEWDIQKILIREGMICGSAILAVSTLVDRLFYGVWTFPPLKFLYFNVAQSLSVFYGQNDIHYYLSQGFPLLLTTALPFTLTGLYRVITRPLSATSNWQTHMLSQLALICMVMPLALSLISHKEVRFVYPLLPSLHVLSASPLVEFFYPAISRSSRAQTPRRLTLVFLLIINVFVALYTTIYHASGTVNILSYLREQHDRHSPPSTAKHSSPGISVGFLMPCHSTPWRSHMVYPTLNAWALTCEPPVNLNTTQKTTYIDEADQFYDNPAHFLRTNMLGGLRHTPRKPTYLSFPRSSSSRKNQPEQHTWPDYLIFFAQLEPTLSSLLRASSYAECHRTFNTAWHDDWRRKGDVVVWCLDPGEQLAWRSVMREAESARVRREKLLGGVVEGVKRGGEFMKGVVGNGVGRVGSGLRDLGRMDWGRAFDFGGLRSRGTAGQWKIQLPWTSSSKSKSRSKKGNTGSLIDLKKVQPQWRWPSWSSKKDKRGSKKRDLWS